MTLERLLVSRKQLRELGVPYSFQHLDRLERAGEFPRRIKLGRHRGSRVVWRYKEVLDWLEARALSTPPLLAEDHPL
jgi:prophage regulatory protein